MCSVRTHAVLIPPQPATRKNSSTGTLSADTRSDKPPTATQNPAGRDIPFSTQRALASLQRVLDDFSSESLGSLGTTTEAPQLADCHSPCKDAGTLSTSPPRLRVRPPTVCSATKPPVSPARRVRHLMAVPSPAKMPAESPLVSPCRRRRRTADSGTPMTQLRKGGWR